MGNRSSRPMPFGNHLSMDPLYRGRPYAEHPYVDHPYTDHPYVDQRSSRDRPSSRDRFYTDRKSFIKAAEAPPSAPPVAEVAPPQKVVVNTNTVHVDAEITGLRQQIMGNANCLYPNRHLIEVIVMSAEFPENGWFVARLVDVSEREVLCGKSYCDSIPKALRELLQETCDDIRDTYVLQNYRTYVPE